MATKQLSPTEGTAAGAAPVTKTKNTVKLIPRKDADVETLATAAATQWKTLPQLTLLWTTQAKFDTLAKSFASTLSARLQAGGSRPAKTVTLKTVNANINAAVTVVKSYIIKKFETETAALPQYARYGMVKQGAYKLPRDNDDRKKALQLMKAAIAEDGFATEKYGTAFWEAAIADFDTATGSTAKAAKDISKEVSGKNELRTAIELHLEAIINLVKANYPTTWQSELRNWGFLKNNY